jgi:hypothetical protein
MAQWTQVALFMRPFLELTLVPSLSLTLTQSIDHGTVDTGSPFFAALI